MDPQMRARWEQLLAPLGVPGDEIGRSLRDLWRRLDEPHRVFHTVSHLRHVLEVVDFVRPHEPVDDPIGIELAAWFHDAVYEPGSEQNEVASARLAGETLLGWGIEDSRVAHVVDLVLATRSHEPEGADAAVLVDADLAVLASPPHAYDLYRRGLRVEFGHLDNPAWAAGRSAFLRLMLDREAIFSTATMRARGEAQARRNMSNELHDLAAG